jgi:hypothetical protein
MNNTRAICITALIGLALAAGVAVWLLMLPVNAKEVLFDGKTTSGWVIDGDAEVKDGVLILGGNQKTRARIAGDFSPQFELHLEYSTENDKPIQLEWHHRRFLGQGMHSGSLARNSKKAGEWIEADYSGKENAAGNWVINSRWHVVGEPGFTEEPLGGAAGRPQSVFVAFEIPVGQKIHLRNVRAKTDPASSYPRLLAVLAAGLVAVFVVAAIWVIVMKRGAPPKGIVQPEQGKG